MEDVEVVETVEVVEVTEVLLNDEVAEDMGPELSVEVLVDKVPGEVVRLSYVDVDVAELVTDVMMIDKQTDLLY